MWSVKEKYQLRFFSHNNECSHLNLCNKCVRLGEHFNVKVFIKILMNA